MRCARARVAAERIAQHDAQLAARSRPEERGMPHLARPGLPQFEIRGKAGAAF